MKMPHLRKCSHWNEFSHLLTHLVKSKNNIFLSWKSNASSEAQRIKASVKLLNVQSYKNRLDMTYSCNVTFKCENNELINLYHEESGALFRGKVLKSVGSALSLIVDELPFLLEKRKDPRLSFDNTHYYVKVSFLSESTQKSKALELRLTDIGIKGAGLMSSAMIAERVHKGDRVKLTSIESIKLPGPIEGKVAHITPVRSDLELGPTELSKLVVIGIQFDVPSLLLAEVFEGLS